MQFDVNALGQTVICRGNQQYFHIILRLLDLGLMPEANETYRKRHSIASCVELVGRSASHGEPSARVYTMCTLTFLNHSRVRIARSLAPVFWHDLK